MKTDIKKALEMRENIQAKHGNDVVTLFRTFDEYELYSYDAITNYFAEDAKTENKDDVQFSFVSYVEDDDTIIVAKASFVHEKLDQVLQKIINTRHRVCIVDAPINYNAR